MFATIKSLIPEPRQADQPRHYVGRHRQPETVTAIAAVPVVPVPVPAGGVPSQVTPSTTANAPLAEAVESPAPRVG
ncbi:hypothetical protein [Pseudosporangium ferrugineum]|uniref:Uncharacterized protein n=1 Tax=Pseudosporangium ferrugineum TaxID=439699 RepID=A0A2T0S154_9ACTN|nr:hypothetical protein [Pseudosporangium ferrugineum]PRY27112.1 hypothetical protein CLV70_11175 [Pseudosporangium ferrugineum]